MHDTELTPVDQATIGLSVADAAELLGVSANTVRAHLRQGTLAGEKIDGAWVVYLADLPPESAPSPSAVLEPLPTSDRATQPSPSRMGTLGRLLLLMLQGFSRRLSTVWTRVSRN
jgi:hypothetical protein